MGITGGEHGRDGRLHRFAISLRQRRRPAAASCSIRLSVSELQFREARRLVGRSSPGTHDAKTGKLLARYDWRRPSQAKLRLASEFLLFFLIPFHPKKGTAGNVDHYPSVFWKVALSTAHHFMRIVLSQFRGLESARYNAISKCSLFA